MTSWVAIGRRCCPQAVLDEMTLMLYLQMEAHWLCFNFDIQYEQCTERSSSSTSFQLETIRVSGKARGPV
jgi:hypothetical protein